jgi:hypothetical protein
MDRSFLSQPEVIAASRRFVCIRLTTYENQEEGRFLMSLQHTRSGQLENTTFALLAPDGKRQLVRASRSARHGFADSEELAETMTRIARTFQTKAAAEAQAELPKVANVRLAVDVAACDNRPLVVLFAPDESTRQSLEERVRSLAWSQAFLGRFIYVATSAAKDLSIIEGADARAGMLVVQADRFGLKGKVLDRARAGASAAELAVHLRQGLARYNGDDKIFRRHVQAGHQLGMFWETIFPVTDPMERQARERGARRARP